MEKIFYDQNKITYEYNKFDILHPIHNNLLTTNLK